MLRQWGEESCVVVYCNAEEGTVLDLTAAGLSDYEMKASLIVGEEAVVVENNEMRLPFGSIVIMK